MENGATQVYAVVTHAVLSGKAIDVLNNSQLTRLVVVSFVTLLSVWEGDLIP